MLNVIDKESELRSQGFIQTNHLRRTYDLSKDQRTSVENGITGGVSPKVNGRPSQTI
jgi:hypothetical protein